ncbi:hypothetical protein [Hymenobacter negativus]|uniref:Integron gene cassette protein n=1 Tax=Hymenobacter negativus TaxID=2795026 RepID=A0ABS3QB31_9BACT|nr:hypothetical protein [Hymenobacter negativus]MBO2008168.1 hypothetical protein [Hymenobacter negativus]
MSIPKKGTRKIVVGGEHYLWLIRRKATYLQADYGDGCLHVAIELAEEPGTTLVVHTDRKHPKDWGTNEVMPVIPSDISQWILQALELDWKPQESGPQLSVRVEGSEMSVAG